MADVLVVDDSATMRKAVVSAFHDAGYTCDEAENGADGLHLALLNPYRWW